VNLNLLKDVKNAYANLKPGAVRDLAEKRVAIGIIASDNDKADFIRSYLGQTESIVERVTESAPAGNFDLLLAEPEFPRPSGAFEFRFHDPERTVDEILDQRQELEIALARNYPAFRKNVVDRIVKRTSQENALFSIVTALPNVVPSFLQLPWAVGEFASDTVFLTMNQVRMAWMVAAANDHAVGYDDQKVELGTIVAGAFGWRTIARELAGKIPLGGGLIPKAAIAYAGTYVVGKGLERLHGTGKGLDRRERRELYDSAMAKGKEVAGRIAERLKTRNAA
jgi:hypothetical protein